MREPVTRDRVLAFLTALAKEAAAETELFVVGGTSAVLVGWREATMDIDFVMRPESDEMLRAIPALKERLHINVELAAPDHFIPVPAGWERRSPEIARIGRVTVRHYDFVAQALAKIERGHTRDLADVAAMLDAGLVTRTGLRRGWTEIEPLLYRYPAVDPESFRRALEDAVAEPGQERK